MKVVPRNVSCGPPLLQGSEELGARWRLTTSGLIKRCGRDTTKSPISAHLAWLGYLRSFAVSFVAIVVEVCDYDVQEGLRGYSKRLLLADFTTKGKQSFPI